jgi:antitoxin (DNA-binding transcriptional repressor) of toxin-antitoxin stability system
MKYINAAEACASFDRLLEFVERGEKVTISQNGKAVAQLIPPVPAHDVAAAQESAERLLALGKKMNLGPFDCEEWKRYRDEGRRM